MPSVMQVSMPRPFTAATVSHSSSMSRSLGERQAAPMQKRVAPPSLARRASATIASAAISLVAFTPVSKWALWAQ
jgi:hypothetical protein